MRRALATARVAQWRSGSRAAPVLRIAIPTGPGGDILFARFKADLASIGVEARRVASDADADSLDATNDVLAQSAERRRILTAGPAGVVEEGPRAPGLMVGAMREVQLNGEAERRGMPPPIPHPGPPTQATFRLQGPHVLSSYDRDEGQYGEDPRQRPVRDSDIAGFHMTTRELAAGARVLHGLRI